MGEKSVKKLNQKIQSFLTLILGATLLTSCASESSRSVEIKQTQANETARSYSGPKKPLIVGRFSNESNYMKGMFSDDSDQLGQQAKTILKGHLQRSGRFSVMDRSIMEKLAKESGYSKKSQNIKGAKFAISGDVTEFGRKNTGDKQLFGIMGSGKKQIAYSKVTLNVVDVETTEVVYSASGAGEYALSNSEVLGFGGTAGYDSTLNGKVLDLAIRDAVDDLVRSIQNGAW